MDMKNFLLIHCCFVSVSFSACSTAEQLKNIRASAKNTPIEVGNNRDKDTPPDKPELPADGANKNVDEADANVLPVTPDVENVDNGIGPVDASPSTQNPEFPIAKALNWANLDAKQKQYSKFKIDKSTPKGESILITTNDPAFHLTGIRMQTTPLRLREELKKSGKPVFVHFELNVGIFTRWNFAGSLGEDSLKFGTQGHIITKQTGGIVDFRADSAPDVFEFTNTINVQRCSEKHGFQCHPLNHLQQVTIKNFGKEDLIILQGRRYRYNDVRNDGTLPDVPASRLKVEKI
ncbi:MAG: hypothetical protein RLZZ488_2177 [Pseudomonadota bacterium]|jgi:hypothetical protein